MNNSREIKIAIDSMGGDLGPSTVINGAFIASKKIPKIKSMQKLLRGTWKFRRRRKKFGAMLRFFRQISLVKNIFHE